MRAEQWRCVTDSDYYRTGLCCNEYSSVNTRVALTKHRFDTVNMNKCDIFNGIVLIQVACSSFPCMYTFIISMASGTNRLTPNLKIRKKNPQNDT